MTASRTTPNAATADPVTIEVLRNALYSVSAGHDANTVFTAGCIVPRCRGVPPNSLMAMTSPSAV